MFQEDDIQPSTLLMRTQDLARRLCELACAALLAFAIEGHADMRETLGAGDTIGATVFQNPDLTKEARIPQEGMILIPLIGEVAVSGRTPNTAANQIATRLKQEEFLKNPQVSVAVVRVLSRQVSVLGLVARPGRYVLDNASSGLTDILALADGIVPGGDDTVIALANRDGRVRKLEVDVPEMYYSDDLSSIVEVQNGGTSLVPRAPVLHIFGEGLRAGSFRLDPNTTVLDALMPGAGLTPRGTERRLKINRRTPDGGIKTHDARMGDPTRPDDVIYVPESLS